MLRGVMATPKVHDEQVIEPGLEPRSRRPHSRALNPRCHWVEVILFWALLPQAPTTACIGWREKNSVWEEEGLGFSPSSAITSLRTLDRSPYLFL